MHTAGPLRRPVLVVDDEAMVREVVCTYLEREGFDTSEAIDGPSALASIEISEPHLIILDVMLPRLDGFSVLTDVRRRTHIPVILLTARTDEVDRILGLELGADDYVTKPFSPRELVARAKSVLRRVDTPLHTTGRMTFDGLVVDDRSREVLVNGLVIDITPKEFDLLLFLVSSPRQVFSRSEILDKVWNSDVEWQDPSTVTVHIRRLRQKIETEADEPVRIVTVWGRGYRFEP